MPLAISFKFFQSFLNLLSKPFKMSVIVYRAKNYYDRYGDQQDLVHRIYPDGMIETTISDDLHECRVQRWKKGNDIYEICAYKSDDEITYEHHKNGELHTDDDEPAYSRTFDGYQSEVLKWYKNGKLHRACGPAVMKNYEQEDIYEREYYVDGVEVEKVVSGRLE